MEDAAELIMRINLYGLAVDTVRWDLLDNVFVPDVDADYGPDIQWRGLEEMKRRFDLFHEPFDATQHTMYNHVVSRTGKGARSIVYAHWRLIRHGVQGGDWWEGTGWYDDAWVRTPAGWRIATRTCRSIWQGGNPLVNPSVPGGSSLRAVAAEGKLGYLSAYGL